MADSKLASAAEVAAAEGAAKKARAAAVDAAVTAGEGANSLFAGTTESNRDAEDLGRDGGQGTVLAAENDTSKKSTPVASAPPWGVIGGEPLVAHLDGHDPRNSGKFVHAGAANTTAGGPKTSEPGSNGSNSTDEMATILARAPHRETKHSGHRQQKQTAAPSLLGSGI